ncbi:hypothetical protein [Fodinibius halophilus]|uniref:Uncharacterized protein n=1 Tax=Fodinibius halophilus TaxID=1736908 RepID=A0A6M1TAH2_9BACT|nr:hypothetical protein [Fodinibius halophilus]NGP89031.1 hypothetical protein [Fodinibius halophilus]
MSVTLKAIKFNHDSASSSHDAINIRKSKNQFISVPEWEKGSSSKAEDSLAAYAIKETHGNTITVQARFTAPDIQSAEIRAIDPTTSPSGSGGCGAWLISLIIKIIQAAFGNVLGEVKKRTITFGSGGDSGFVSFDLKNTSLTQSGVGIHYTTWKWQYRRNSGQPWQDIQTTKHKIYVLLETPTAPWQQSPYNASNTQLPWTDVMDHSCLWALGTKDRDSAAGKVTENVYDLGPSTLQYDCPGGGASHYAYGNFNCTQFLNRLDGGSGLGKYVNCTDCATIVSTFSNVLGCDLWQSQMGYGFQLNDIIAIGYSNWYPGCSNWPNTGFSYHEVAWKGGCDTDDEVFDACLQVDGDNDPTSSPHTPLLPINMRFGTCNGPLEYRRRLSPLGANGCQNCSPKPSTKKRRQII